MFNPEVADYIYTLESGNAGAGVSLFKTLFADEYYPYTANTLISAKPTSKVIKDSNNQTVATIVYSGNELRGLLKVGTDGLYTDGDIDDGSGSTQVRYGIVDLGSLDYAYYGGRFNTTGPIADLGGELSGDYYVNVICAKYVNSSSNTDKTFFVYNNKYIYIYDSAYTDATAFKNALDGVYLVYELATPTTAVSTAWSNPIIAKEGGTETFVDGNFYARVDLGSLDYVYSDGGFTTQLPNNSKELNSNAEVLNCISDRYEVMSWNDATYNAQSGTMGTGVQHYIKIFDSAYTDATAFKNAMSGTYLFYEISTSTFELPTGHDTIYGTDLSVKKAEFGTTVYGGSVDFTTGEVISNKNADGTDKTAETISITPVEVRTNAGTNNVFSDTNGNTTAQYIDKR